MTTLELSSTSSILAQIPTAFVLGVRIHQVTIAEAASCVRQLIAAGGAHQVVTVNGAMLLGAMRDDRVRALFNNASLVTPDGVGVLLAGRILGYRFAERVAGVDLVERLCAHLAGGGVRVFLLGAKPGVADAAVTALRARYPGLDIAGVQHGYFAREEEASILERIRAMRPHLLLVGLGSPRQEEWIAKHLQVLAPIVCIGVGGTIDVLAGRRHRAPRWMQRAGLEWVYRVVREPRRWKVLATLPLVVWFAFRDRLAGWWKAVSRSV